MDATMATKATELAQTLRTWATLLPPDADPFEPPDGYEYGTTIDESGPIQPLTAHQAIMEGARVLRAWEKDIAVQRGHNAYVYEGGAYAGHVARPHGWTVYVRVGAPRHGRRITGLSRRGAI